MVRRLDPWRIPFGARSLIKGRDVAWETSRGYFQTLYAKMAQFSGFFGCWGSSCLVHSLRCNAEDLVLRWSRVQIQDVMGRGTRRRTTTRSTTATATILPIATRSWWRRRRRKRRRRSSWWWWWWWWRWSKAPKEEEEKEEGKEKQEESDLTPRRVDLDLGWVESDLFSQKAGDEITDIYVHNWHWSQLRSPPLHHSTIQVGSKKFPGELSCCSTGIWECKGSGSHLRERVAKSLMAPTRASILDAKKPWGVGDSWKMESHEPSPPSPPIPPIPKKKHKTAEWNPRFYRKPSDYTKSLNF